MLKQRKMLLKKFLDSNFSIFYSYDSNPPVSSSSLKCKEKTLNHGTNKIKLVECVKSLSCTNRYAFRG